MAQTTVVGFGTRLVEVSVTVAPASHVPLAVPIVADVETIVIVGALGTNATVFESVFEFTVCRFPTTSITPAGETPNGTETVSGPFTLGVISTVYGPDPDPVRFEAVPFVTTISERVNSDIDSDGVIVIVNNPVITAGATVESTIVGVVVSIPEIVEETV
jgi:hypothetical protein